ncbi:NADH-quinone oxidoreductase subunit NuoK [Buchnera aphidicola]|uniref:NADH-quinone oxidoreductase subunit NuoK n=1 Tax=Buchnera aphidicola TaxID=9 RepID=UPI0034642872
MISLFHFFAVSFILLFIGFTTFIINKNIFFIFIGLEVIINAIALLFIAVGKYWNHIDGQIMYILLITLSAIEASISLILLIRLYRKKYTLNINKLNEKCE